MRKSLMIAALLALGGCAHEQADRAAYAQTALVGLPKQTLLACAGAPMRSARLGDNDYYTYSSARTDYYPDPGFGPGFGGWRGGGAYYAGPDIESYSCDATFVLHDNVVQRITYGGSTAAGTGRLDQCYHIVENCLAYVPPPPAP